MKNNLHVLLAPDSFKGSIRAVEVCKHLKEGLLQSSESFRITELPMADGGEGTVQALVASLGGQYRKVMVHDPLMRLIEAEYGLIRDGRIAVIEMAAASGLELLDKSEYNPLITTTFGTGELILDALDNGCRHFIIGIGGSATNDGGAGMLEALGLRLQYKFSEKTGAKGGGSLGDISNIDFRHLDARLEDCSFQIACDVTNPLTGVQGATMVFAPQKGAQSEDLSLLDAGLQHWGHLVEKATGRRIVNIPGAGAAGGLGAGLLCLPHAELCSGFEIVQEAVDLESHIRKADIILTGEGKVDGQTQYGKVVSGIGRLASKYDKPVICLTGTNDDSSRTLLDNGITAIFSIINRPMDLEQAIKSSPELLRESAHNLGRILQLMS